jgi:hypothetical protein
LIGKPILDGDVLSFDPSKIAHFLPERFQETNASRSTGYSEESYAGNFFCLLRLCPRPAEREYN